MEHTPLTGQRFGRLIATKRLPDSISPSGQTRIIYECRCDCGNTARVLAANLRSGHTQSCSCLNREINAKLSYIHGGNATRLYRIWDGMKQRCKNSNYPKFYNYGGRGITLCPEWERFTAFQDWAVTTDYRDDLTIDRIDTNGNYEPTNCRWATPTEQANNTRKNVLLTYAGKTQTTAQWAREIGVNVGTIRSRIRYGWDIESVLTQTVGRWAHR
jgi:hypothetical protein